MNFGIYYFVDEEDKEPVREYLQDLTEPERAKVYAYLHHLSEVGYQLKRPQGDYLGDKTELYELRPGRHRVLYFFIHRNKIILLHAFLKKTQEMPEREIKTAMKRKETCKVLLRFNAIEFDE